MYTTKFDYKLPMGLIAQEPVEPRDQSRLMVVDKKKHKIKHKHFFDIVDYLRPGDLLVWNNSKVFKARLFGELLSDKGEPFFGHKKKIEIFLVRPMENKGVWQVLARPGRHLGAGMKVRIAPGFVCEIMIKKEDGTVLVQFDLRDEEVREKANKFGKVPLPPYIKDEKHELEAYQTLYAKHEGSVAAPTAGFHFTDDVVKKLKDKGVEFAEVTLHVGLGTFLPVKSEKLEDHTMHSEWIELDDKTVGQIKKAKTQGRRVIAVGTTTTRTLEGVAKLEGGLQPYEGEIDIFIKPGFKFEVIDGLITNFHLPKSTLLVLVSAFVGKRKFMLKCYKKAVRKKYRFFSFGDAMFIH